MTRVWRENALGREQIVNISALSGDHHGERNEWQIHAISEAGVGGTNISKAAD
jgi:hypothetical protein